MNISGIGLNAALALGLGWGCRVAEAGRKASRIRCLIATHLLRLVLAGCDLGL